MTWQREWTPGSGALIADIRELRTTLLQVGGGLIGAMLVGFLAVIATIVTTA